MRHKKNKTTNAKPATPSPATIARREARIAALARAITIMIFALGEAGGAA